MDSNFQNNLAQAVSNKPGFKSISGSIFELESGKHNMDGYVHVQNGQIDRHQFQKCLFTLLSSNSMEQRVFKLESRNQSISDELMSKMGKWTNTIFNSNLTLVVSNHPVKCQIDWTKHLCVRVRKPKYFR